MVSPAQGQLYQIPPKQTTNTDSVVCPWAVDELSPTASIRQTARPRKIKRKRESPPAKFGESFPESCDPLSPDAVEFSALGPSHLLPVCLSRSSSLPKSCLHRRRRPVRNGTNPV